MMASELGTSSAPPTPCTARAANSCPGSGARAQGASALVDLMNSSSQGCFSALLMGVFSTRKEEPALATSHLPALRKKTGEEPAQRVPDLGSILAGARRA
jgi:hypothetical protein